MRRKTVQIITPIFILLFTGLIFGYALIQADEIQLGRAATAVDSAFTYQGRLNDDGAAATGNYDFQFALYDDVAAGSQVGSTINQTLAVSNGLFTTNLDFGDGVFDGGPRFLDIAVKLSGGGGYTSLTPRQAINAAPYASYADKVQPLANVVNVAKSGGDYTSVSGALAGINDASAINPYVIHIAPGVYTDTIDLKPYIDIEGSGEYVTILRGLGGSSVDPSVATIRADSIIAPEVRSLTVESKGPSGGFALAIWTKDTDKFLRLTNISVNTSAGSSSTGIEIDNSSPILTNVTVSSAGYFSSIGVLNSSSFTTMNNVNVSASYANNSYGVLNTYSSPVMNNVTADADGDFNSYGIYNDASSPKMDKVTATGNSGDKAYGVFNTNYSYPLMNNVTANGQNASLNSYGIYNDASSPTMDNVTAFGNVGTNSYGVFNTNYSSPLMNNVTAIGQNASNNSYGIYNGESSPTITNSTATGSHGANKNRGVYNFDSNPFMDNVQASTSGGGTSHIGVVNEDSSVVTIQDSTLQGADGAISNGGGSSTKIANTELDGGVTVGGGLTCVGAYNSAFVALNATCQ